jgi:hypothetical protein
LRVIWELYVLGLKFKVFCKKTKSNTPNHEQMAHSAKMGTVVWPKIPKIAPPFFGRICLPTPESLGFSERSSIYHSDLKCPITFGDALW